MLSEMLLDDAALLEQIFSYARLPAFEIASEAFSIIQVECLSFFLSSLSSLLNEIGIWRAGVTGNEYHRMCGLFGSPF